MIDPALTAEQWAQWEEVVRDSGVTLSAYLRGYDYRRPAQAMALGNCALPDTDPHKFTREDAELVRWFATWASNGYPLVTDEKQDALHRVADKLAALLPPEAP